MIDTQQIRNNKEACVDKSPKSMYNCTFYTDFSALLRLTHMRQFRTTSASVYITTASTCMRNFVEKGREIRHIDSGQDIFCMSVNV